MNEDIMNKEIMNKEEVVVKKPKRKPGYVKNKDLLHEIIVYKENIVNGRPKMSETLGKMVILIATGLSQKGNFNGYTWKEDMIGDAILTVVKYLPNFNPEKSQNAFAYVTQICSRAFIAYLNKQKRHSKIKNDLFEFNNSDFSAISNTLIKDERTD